MIKISIITICFNNLDELKSTIESVDLQLVKPYEHLIIDGSTNKAIKEYLAQNNQPTYRRSIHEKDNGIADAFNKGINHSQGDVLVMLNSADRFFDANTLAIVSRTFKENPAITWTHSKYQLFRSNKWIIIGKPHHPKKVYRGMRSICHQTMFVKKELYQKYGGYDTSLKIGMDYDFLLRIKDEPFIFISSPLVTFSQMELVLKIIRRL